MHVSTCQHSKIFNMNFSISASSFFPLGSPVLFSKLFTWRFHSVLILHLQIPLILDNAFLFSKSISPVICHQTLNKSSFWAMKEYQKFQPCLKGKKWSKLCIRNGKSFITLHHMIKSWARLFIAKHCQEQYVLMREPDCWCIPRLGAC